MRGKQAKGAQESAQKSSINSGVAIALLAAITAAAMFALFSLISRSANEAAGSVVTVTGTPVCLPHKPDVVLTMECAVGLRGDDGRNYALEYSTYNPAQEDFGKRVRVKGKLSAPHPDTKYDIDGAINVSSVTRQ